MQNTIEQFKAYSIKLNETMEGRDWSDVEKLADALFETYVNRKRIYLCGNGGSAGNAIHLANDFLYGVTKDRAPGFRIMALPANSAVLTCLANDISYDDVYSEQLKALGEKDDILIILSGSGNSENVVRALQIGNEIGMRTFAILGYSGGKCKDLAATPIHFDVDDMQISEDMQLIVGHMLMQHLYVRIGEHLDSRGR